jgi:hypothetical protein
MALRPVACVLRFSREKADGFTVHGVASAGVILVGDGAGL